MATIRPAAASDASPLFELVRTFPTPTPPTSEQFSKALDAKLPDASSCLLVAERDRHLVGYVSGQCHATLYAGGPTAWVDEQLVIEPLRGTGIGRTAGPVSMTSSSSSSILALRNANGIIAARHDIDIEEAGWFSRDVIS